MVDFKNTDNLLRTKRKLDTSNTPVCLRLSFLFHPDQKIR